MPHYAHCFLYKHTNKIFFQFKILTYICTSKQKKTISIKKLKRNLRTIQHKIIWFNITVYYLTGV